MTQYHIQQFIIQALQEDLGRGDLYALIAQDREATAYVLAKEEGVFSGFVYLEALAKHFDIKILESHKDGECFKKGTKLCVLSGSHIALLQMERVLLNILAHSSGIATLTYAYSSKISNLPIKLLDTRKTRPLLRELEKYSVVNGGGSNHRFGLDSMLMLKDTHLAHITDLRWIISTARERVPFMCPIEVECESLESAINAMGAGADVVMCDNMSIDEIEKVVAYRNEYAKHTKLEASGNISLENIVEYAQSGVDAISVGSLIHQAKWLDLSLKIHTC